MEASEIPPEECFHYEDGNCAGPVELRPGVRLTNVMFAYCERHWQEHLAATNWDDVHQEQSRLGVEKEEEKE